MAPPADHDCPWREEAERLAKKVADQDARFEAMAAKMAALERHVLGPKSERMPSVASELAREKTSEEDRAKKRAQAKDRRRQNAQLKAGLRSEQIHHPVAAEQRRCPHCGTGDSLRPLGDGEVATVYEYVPGHFIRQEHVREKLACRCGQHVVTAEPPVKPWEKGQYGPGFIAHVVTTKCGDSVPHYRLEKQCRRVGIPIARSTITHLFHAAAELLAPLCRRLMERIRTADVVQADETSLKVLAEKRRGYVWTFLADKLVGYRFSVDRSGQTPSQLLGGTKGTLVVDAYTGYNEVTKVDGRTRSGCLAHCRRKFFESLQSAPEEARRALELILDVYRVEHEAAERRIVRTAEHLALRKSRGKAAMDAFKAWLDEQAGKHLPKGPMAVAVRYALNNWTELTRFLDDVRVPVDNNNAERALKVVALGRRNFLFVHHKKSGENLAGLYSLLATCEANQVEPIGYLKDVLVRVHTHPHSKIDELLPDAWRPPDQLAAPPP
jgi:transposase